MMTCAPTIPHATPTSCVMVKFRCNGFLSNFLLRQRILGQQQIRRLGTKRNITVEATVGGRDISFSSGKLALLADGAVVVKSSNTSLLVTAVSKPKPSFSNSGLPLSVDYRDRASAISRIPRNFFRRELQASEREIVTSRCIDRSIRPLFPRGYACDTQVISNLLQLDGLSQPSAMAINGASAALSLSDIPWNGPVAAVHVGFRDGQFASNLTVKEAFSSPLNLIVSCTEDKIIMLEGYGDQLSEETICNAVEFGFNEAQPLLAAIKSLRDHHKKPLRNVELAKPSEILQAVVDKFCYEGVLDILHNTSHKKLSRDNQLFELRDNAKVHIEELVKGGGLTEDRCVDVAFWSSVKKAMNHLVMNERIRCDGRGLNDLRPIECEIGLFDGLHGSSTFLRGETQVLSTVTFDSSRRSMRFDEISSTIGLERSSNFILHYEFPPFATNETGPFLYTGRREIGHATLAKRALKPLLPINFPFAIRVTSQVTDSNGSSSMATVCGSSLALFDAGVQISNPAAGVACGLMLEREPDSGSITRHTILADLSGIEDASGYMDFKIAGTREGITSLQVDIKDIDGLSYDIVKDALMISKDARHRVLDRMDSYQAEPRRIVKPNTPVHKIMEVPFSKRHRLGGYTLKALSDETGADVYQGGEDTITVSAPTQKVMDEVMKRINALLSGTGLDGTPTTLEIGAIYTAQIIDIRSYGLIIELLPSRDRTLLHVKQLDHKLVPHPEELGFQLGQEISVKYFGRDEAGHLRVSRKALFADPYRKTSSVGDGNITSVEKAIMDHVKDSQTEIDNKEKTNQEKSVKN